MSACGYVYTHACILCLHACLSVCLSVYPYISLVRTLPMNRKDLDVVRFQAEKELRDRIFAIADSALGPKDQLSSSMTTDDICVSFPSSARLYVLLQGFAWGFV